MNEALIFISIMIATILRHHKVGRAVLALLSLWNTQRRVLAASLSDEKSSS